MGAIFSLMKWMSNICLGLSLFYFVVFVYTKIKEKISFSEFKKHIRNEFGSFSNVAAVILTLGIVSTLMFNGTVQQTIGLYNLYLIPEGEYSFYVDVDFWEDDNNVEGKYPAKIRVETETEEDGMYDEKRVTYKYFFVDYIYINGKEYDIIGSDPVEIDKESWWYVDNTEINFTLRNQHAFSENIEETDHCNWISITFILLELLAMGACLIALISKKENNEE